MDLNSILASLTSNANARTAAIDAQANEMGAATQRAQQGFDANQVATGLVADEAARIAGEKAAVNFQQESALQQVAATFGVNPDEQSYVIANLMADYQAAEDGRLQVRAKYDSLASKDLLSDPIGYIFAQLELPAVAAQNNAFASAKESAAQDIKTRQQLMIQAKQSTTVNTADQLKTIRLAEAANARQAADIQLSQAALDMDSKIAGQKLQEFQLRDKKYDVNDSLFNKTLQVQEFQMNQERLNLAREEAKARRDAVAKDKKKEEDNLAQLNAGLALVSRFVGARVPLNVDILKEMKDPKKKQILIEAAMNDTLGNNVIETIDLVNSVGNMQTLAQTNPGFYKALMGAEQGIKDQEAAILRSPEGQALRTKPAELRKLAGERYQGTLVTQASNLGSTNTLSSPAYDRVFSPYKANHKVMLQEPALANNSFTKALTLVATTNADRVSRESNIPAELEQLALSSIVAQVQKGTLGVDDAARDLVAYHTVAAKKNFDMYQYTQMGLPAQSNAVITIPAASYWGTPANTDAMDFAKTKAALVRVAASGKEPAAANWGGSLGIVR